MKRFTKISLILSGGFLLLGIVLCLTAYTMEEESATFL